VFLLLALPLIVVLVSKKKFKQLSKAIGACLVGIGFLLLLTYLFLGQFSAYSGPGSYGYLSPSQIPYLTMEGVRKGLVIVGSPLEDIGFNNWGLFFRNILYFFIGRFTGIIWYAFPAVICAGIYLLNRRYISKEEKIAGDSILIATFLLAVILIVARPLNYFGGRGFICNRYFFILPALLYLPTIKMIKNPKKILLMFLPGLIVSSQIIINEFYFDKLPMGHWANKQVYARGVHTCTFPLRYAPLEITSLESLAINNVEVSHDVLLYIPLGLSKRIDKKILIDAGQEVVIVKKDSIDPLRLKTDKDEIILKPKVKLKNKLNGQYKSLYYFKADRSTWINSISF